jgi:hypothetical protein
VLQQSVTVYVPLLGKEAFDVDHESENVSPAPIFGGEV